MRDTNLEDISISTKYKVPSWKKRDLQSLSPRAIPYSQVRDVGSKKEEPNNECGGELELNQESVCNKTQGRMSFMNGEVSECDKIC